MPENRHSGRDRKRKHPSSPSTAGPRTSPYAPNRPSDNYSPRNAGSGGRPGRRGRQSSTSQQSQQQLPPPVPRTSSRRVEESAIATDDTMHLTTTPTPPATPKDFYFWEFLSDANVRDWQSVGASRVQEALSRSITSEDVDEVCIILQEIVKATIELRISASDSAKFVAHIMATYPKGGDSGINLRELFLSTIAGFEEPTGTPPESLTNLLLALCPNPIASEVFASYLETSTLMAMGLVSAQFSKKIVRVTTSLVYKQRKHNLLREETEGFSKLITEFFTASYSSSPLEVVGRTGERVKGLVGAFELDPGRVLDVLLDTAACTVVSNARFFVRLLRESAWWPKQLPSLVEEELNNAGKSREELKAEKEKEKIISDAQFFEKLLKEGVSAFFEYGGEPRKGGNRVAAQLLGFKFRYYQEEDVREHTPENLLVLSALLIKIGFVDLADLYPHLSPRDEDGMNELYNAWKQKLEERGRGGKRNALMMAGALVDDTLPLPSMASRSRSTGPSTTEERKAEERKAEERKAEEPKPRKKEDNQKIVLLKYLLALGALPEAMFILGKYPFLPGPADDIAEHLGRVLIQSIETVYSPLKCQRTETGMKKTVVSTPGGGTELLDQPKRKPMVTFTVSNLKLKTGDIEYRFFWEEWKDGVPVCRNATDVVVLMDSLGKVLGPRIGRDYGVMSRVCRIGRRVLTDPNCKGEDRDRWINLSRSIIIPAISLTEGNQGLVTEAWRLLECFSAQTRYSLYGEWATVTSKRIPDIKFRVAEAERETKNLLKRISKTNVKLMARQLAKVATSLPVTVMQVVLSQVEGYDNLIECVVDAARYFTPLGFDAVGFCVLNSMSKEGKDRVQADGMLTSRWLQSLAQFCGKIYTRYHKQMDPTPVLEYVARQLKRNISVDLIVLQQLIQSMAGINPEVNYNDLQLQSLAGGGYLRKRVLEMFRDPKAENSPDTTGTLMYTLTKSGLAPQLLVLIAQERQTCVFRLDESAPLKVLGNLFDEVHVVFAQYLDLLKAGLDEEGSENYERIIPSVGVLCLEFGLDPAIAWWIARHVIHDRIVRLESDNGEDIEMKDAEDASPKNAAEKRTWNPVLKKVMDEFRPVLPEEVWSKFSLSFYVTFWQLSVYDIFVPVEAYKLADASAVAAIREMDRNRSDISASGMARRRERKEEQMATLKVVSEAMKTHIRDYNRVKKRLTYEKDYWFADEHSDQREVTNSFIQYCLFPRMMLSPNDASFCSKIIRELHRLATPKFHTIGVYDAIFGKSLGTIIFTSTHREADNFGRFLKDILTDLHAWHADKELYEKEAHGIWKDNSGAWREGKLLGFNVKGSQFDWEDFRKILYKWHKTIHNAVKNCLSSKEYMHIRNTVVILKHIVQFFPAVDWIGRTVVEKVDEISKNEKREDLKIASSTLLGLLRKKEKEWVVVAGFQKEEQGAKSEALTPVVSASKQPSPAPTPAPTQQPAPVHQNTDDKQANSSLVTRAATETRSNSIPSTTTLNGPSTPALHGSLPSRPEAEKEDGEIDDNKGNKEVKRVPNLPQRPAVIASPLRRQPSKDPPRPQHVQQPPINEPPRAGTPRRDEAQNVRSNPDMSRTPNLSNRGPQLQNRPQTLHQLPDRPQVQQLQHDRSRDLRDSPRDMRSSIDVRGTAGRPVNERLPDRPSDRPTERRPSPPRRDNRDQHRRDGDRSRGRDDSFQRPALPVRGDDRVPRIGERKEVDIRPDTAPSRPNQQQQISSTSSRSLVPDTERTRRPERLDDRLRRHDRPDLSNHQMEPDRQDHSERRMPERRPSDQSIPRQQPVQEDIHSQRPPAGPRADVERERERRNRQDGPPTPKERDLFSGAPPRGPSVADFRETRHPPPPGIHQDPNHGRLNPPDLAIPKGPRAPIGPRGGLSRLPSSPAVTTAPRPPPNNNTSSGTTPLPSPSTETKPIPVVSPLAENKPELPKPAAAPVPSASEADTAGVHPDRLRNMGVLQGPQQQQQQQPQSPTLASQSPQSSLAPTHSSRLQVLQGVSTPTSPSTPGPPSGPRNTATAGTTPPAALSPTAMSNPPPAKLGSPPTGPSRGDRGDEVNHQRRRMMAMQSIIGQGSGNGDVTQGSSIRGRVSRRTNTGGSLGRDGGGGSSSRNSLPSSGDSGRRGNGIQPEINRRTSLAGPDSGRPNSASGGSVGDKERERDRERPPSDHGSRSGRHGRDRGDRDRERDRDRDRERDRARDGDRDRERERQQDRDRDRGIDRDRGAIDRERGPQDRDRDRDRERDRESRDRHLDRDRERERDLRRGSAAIPIGGSGGRDRDRDRDREKDRDRRDRDRKHGRGENDGGRKDDVKRRRRGDQGGW